MPRIAGRQAGLQAGRHHRDRRFPSPSTHLRSRQDIRIGVDPGQRLADDDSEGEDVDLLVVGVAAQTFGRHPKRRPDDRQLPRRSSRRRHGLFRHGQAEIADESGEAALAGPAAVVAAFRRRRPTEEDVVGGEVTMNNVSRVEVLHSFRRFPQ